MATFITAPANLYATDAVVYTALFYLGAPFLISGHMHATLCHSVGQSVGLLVCWSVFLVSVILVAK